MARSAIKVYLKSAIRSGFEFIKRRFGSVEELNRNFQEQRKWIFEKMERKTDFKRRLARVLEVLKMHSCKHIGISFLTENSLCVAYEEQFGEPISKRSVGTYVKQLKEISFVSIIPAKREDGKQTANIVVIERFRGDGRSGGSLASEAVERQVSEDTSAGRGENRPGNVAHKEPENLRTDKTTSPFKTTVKEIKERMASGKRLLNFVPRWFRERIGCCAREGREVYEFWKVAKHLMKRTFGAVMSIDEWRETVDRAIREFFLSAKAVSRGKFKMDNPFGFFHAVLEAEGYAHLRRRTQNESGVLYDWLED